MDEMMLTPEEMALRKRYFPRVPWGPDGPVRRRYRVRAAEGVSPSEALAALAEAEGFTAPDRPWVEGDGAVCLAAFQDRLPESGAGLVIGRGLDAYWCDLALGAPDSEGWQELIVRSETGENLIALAHGMGTLRFRKSAQ